jgi:hypothetical protein
MCFASLDETSPPFKTARRIMKAPRCRVRGYIHLFRRFCSIIPCMAHGVWAMILTFGTDNIAGALIRAGSGRVGVWGCSFLTDNSQSF